MAFKPQACTPTQRPNYSLAALSFVLEAPLIAWELSSILEGGCRWSLALLWSSITFMSMINRWEAVAKCTVFQYSSVSRVALSLSSYLIFCPEKVLINAFACLDFVYICRRACIYICVLLFKGSLIKFDCNEGLLLFSFIRRGSGSRMMIIAISVLIRTAQREPAIF